MTGVGCSWPRSRRVAGARDDAVIPTYLAAEVTRWRRRRRSPDAGTANDHNGHDRAPFVAADRHVPRCGDQTPMARRREPNRRRTHITGRITGARTSPVRSERVGVGGVALVEHAARSRAPRPRTAHPVPSAIPPARLWLPACERWTVHARRDAPLPLRGTSPGGGRAGWVGRAHSRAPRTTPITPPDASPSAAPNYGPPSRARLDFLGALPATWPTGHQRVSPRSRRGQAAFAALSTR